MLFVITNSRDDTANFLEAILKEHGVHFFRFDTDTALSTAEFSFRTGCPIIKQGEHYIRASDITNVWYRRPQRLIDARFSETPEGRFARSEWTEALESFFAHIPRALWMNHPTANAAASNKLEQLTVAAGLGLSIPETLVTQDPDELRRFFDHCGGRLVVKPMASGYVERPDEETDTLVFTNRVLSENLTDLRDLSVCPTLFQRYISKELDVRITVVDGEAHSYSLSAKDSEGFQRCDIRRNNMLDVTYAPIELPTHVWARVRSLIGHYGLRFAAIDMAVSFSGEWVFFEVNPNGQWAWLDLAGVSNIAASFTNSFAERR